MAGVTNAGFAPKRFNEIITSLQENAKPIFQDLVQPGEEVDVGDTSTIGRLIGLVALDLDEVWQALQQVYQAFDPNSATGIALDNIVQYGGLTRQLGKPTVLRASVWGSVGTFLPVGQAIRGTGSEQFISTTDLNFSTEDIIGFSVSPNGLVEGSECGFTFITEEGIFTLSRTILAGDTLDDILNDWLAQFGAILATRVDGYIQNNKFYVVLKDYFAYITVPAVTNSIVIDVKKRLTFDSQEDGDIKAPVNTVTTILTPVFGWTSVSNEISAEKGSVLESDEELRERFRLSKAVRAANTSEAIYSQLLELEGVDHARIYENMTDSVDLKGLPPHSFMAVVLGGTTTDIGEVVWNNEPLGIASYGNTQVTVRDSQNFEREVSFSRPTEVPIYVNITLTRVGNTFPTDGVDQVRQAVFEALSANAGFGEDIIYTRLFTPINSVPGHQVDVLEIGKSSLTLGTTNIPINWDEYPVALLENIQITVTN